ncbi:MAG: hypothetical protein AAGJ52_13200 [Pseudomonadota bacterium]
MPQAVLKSTPSSAFLWWQQTRINAQLLLLGCRELLALLSLIAGLGLGLLAMAESLGRFAGS